MELTLDFLGTRGEIDRRTRDHFRHSALLVSIEGRRLMLDCGSDWLGRLEGVGPDAIVLTHAHPDHADGLRDGAPCPVYATQETIARIGRFGLQEVLVVAPRAPFRLLGLELEAFPLEHSLIAPAVGYRIRAGDAAIFYAPDVLSILDRSAALQEIRLYVGDGASLTRSIVRRRNGVGIGHASIRTQLGWCAEEGVHWAIFTHCGSQLVRGDPGSLRDRVAELGRKLGVRAEIASDGRVVTLSG